VDGSGAHDPRSSPGGSASARAARIAPFAGSCAGLALAALLPWLIPPRRDLHLPPGFAAAQGLDLRRQLLLYASIVVLTLAGGAAGAWWARRGRADSPRRVSVPDGLAPRHLELGLGAAAVLAHAILVWIFLVSGFPRLAVWSVGSLVLAAAASAAAAAVLGRGHLTRGAAYLAAASPILILAFLGQRPLPFARWAALAAFVLPVLAFALGSRSEEAQRVLRRLTVGLLLPGSFTALAAAACLGVPPVADLFEDGHALLPASEYLRGELPYRDVVPGHGLLSDGLFDATTLELFGDDYRGYSRGRKLLGALFWPCVFALGFAATGSPATGFWALALSFLCFPQYAFPRPIVSLATVALATLASRTGKRWPWILCGAALVVAALVSVDFAVYAAAAVAAALVVARGDRRSHLISLLSGALPAAVIIAVSLAAFGILDDFARTTILLLPALFPAYALGFPTLSASPMAEVPSIPFPVLYGVVLLALVLLAAELPRGERVREPARGVLPVLAWIVLAMLSVVERWHFGYLFLAVPTALILLARWFRVSGGAGPPRALVAGVALAAFASLHNPIELVRAVANGIQKASFFPDTLPLEQPRRARGATFRRWDQTLLLETSELMRRAGFEDGDTWLDFANEPGLYFLFERPCPIRYYEVPFYESEAAQDEVIEAISREPHVRAALIAAPYGEIDGIPNATRAPRVWAYLRAHFRPFLRENGIEFWIRATEARGARPAV